MLYRILDALTAVTCLAVSATGASESASGVTGVGGGVEGLILQYGVLGIMVVWFMIRERRQQAAADKREESMTARIRELEDYQRTVFAQTVDAFRAAIEHCAKRG